MAAREKVEFVISARDRTRAALRRIGRGFIRIGRLAKAGAAAAVAGFIAMGAAAARLARELSNTADLLGTNINELDRLRQVAAGVGIPMEDLKGALEEFRVRSGDAIGEAGELRKTFEQFGITVDNLKGENLIQLLLRIADVAKRANEQGRLPQLRSALDRLGGGEFLRLLPLLLQGPEALAASLKAAKPTNREDVSSVLRAESSVRGRIAVAQSASIGGTAIAADAIVKQTTALTQRLDKIIEHNRKTEDQTFGVFGA